MPEERPLCTAKKGVGFHVRGAGAGADTAELVFDEEFADEGFTETRENVSGATEGISGMGKICDMWEKGSVKRTSIFAAHQHVPGKAHHLSIYWQTSHSGSSL